jgi:hypothetical protein
MTKEEDNLPHKEVAILYVTNDDETKILIIHKDNNP